MTATTSLPQSRTGLMLSQYIMVPGSDVKGNFTSEMLESGVHQYDSEYLGLKADANLLPSDFNIASGHHNPPPIDDQLLLDAYHQQK